MRVEIFHAHHAYLPNLPTLSDFSLTFPAGQFCFVIGASGAGKSTIFKLIFGSERPHSGQILVDQWNVHRLTHQTRPLYRREVGYIFQDLKLLSERTALENIALPLETVGIHRSEQRRRVYQLLHRIGLTHVARSRVDQLSGGERQRVAIARALVHHPRLILADEPTGSLDPERSQDMMDLLYEQSIKGVTVIVSTHSHHLLSRYGCRVIHLQNGRIIEDYQT